MGIFIDIPVLFKIDVVRYQPRICTLLTEFARRTRLAISALIKSPTRTSARKVDASPFRSIFTRGLDWPEQCVVTARRSKLLSEGG